MGESWNKLVCIAPLAIVISLAAPLTATAQRTNWTAKELSNPFPAARTEQELIESLRTGGPADKAIACKQLSIYGSKAAVPELAKLLADEELASWARIALEAIPDPAADEALLEAAQKLDGLLLVGTINSLGVRRTTEAVDHLAERLQDQDIEVASAAAVALGRIGGDHAIHALHQAFAGALPAVRSAIAEGGILCAERCMAEGNSDTAIAIYDVIRDADLPKQRVVEAIRGAIIARGDEGIPLLVEHLKSDDKAYFQIALSTARELPGTEVAEALAAQLAGAPPQRAALIAAAIGDCQVAVLPRAVVEAARIGSPQVRLAAIEVIGKRGDAASVPALLEIASDSNSELSHAAKAALSKLPGDKVDAELVQRLSTVKSKALVVLIELAGQRRIDDAAAELVNLSRNPDKAIRRAAIAALGATAGPKELNTVLITEVANATNTEDRDVAWQALEEASVRMPDREATATDLAAAMSRNGVVAEPKLLRVLGEVGGTKALQAVAAAAQSDDRELQDEATRVLGEWMTADAAPHLYKIASSDNAFNTRALRGYLRIARQLDIPDAQRLEMCRKALAIAERPQERELALEAMKRCESAEAVELASSLLDDRELRNRAVEAAIFIGEKIKDKDPVAAKRAGEKALEAAPNGRFAERARALSNGQ